LILADALGLGQVTVVAAAFTIYCTLRLVNDKFAAIILPAMLPKIDNGAEGESNRIRRLRPFCKRPSHSPPSSLRSMSHPALRLVATPPWPVVPTSGIWLQSS
jgi:hypothetical protein